MVQRPHGISDHVDKDGLSGGCRIRNGSREIVQLIDPDAHDTERFCESNEVRVDESAAPK